MNGFDLTTGTGKNRRGLFSNEPLLFLGLLLLILYFARDLCIPLAMALTLNFLLAPAVVRLEQFRLPRGPSVVLVVLLAFSFLLGVGWVVARQLLDVASELPGYQQNIDDKLASIHIPTSGPLGNAIRGVKILSDNLSGIRPAAPPPPEEATRIRSSRRAREAEKSKLQDNTKPTQVVIVQPPISNRAYAQQILKPVLKPLGMAGMVLIFTIYLLVKRNDLRNRLLLLAGVSRLNVMTQALEDAAHRVSRYLLMNVLVNACFGVVFGIGLFLLHVPNATLWGVLLGILRMVPYAGMIVGGGLPVFFAFAIFPGWWPPFFVLLMFVVLEIVVSNFIEPWIYGSHTGISALALVTMATVWTLLWGIPGLILSTPLTVCLIVMGRYVPQMSFLNILMGDEAQLTPEAHFYERLLAMDQPAAQRVADQFLEANGITALYDDVVLPALSLAEQDRHKGFLDDARSSFLFQCVTELVAELAEYQDRNSGTERAKNCPVVCVPSSDQADEIAAIMLAQILERRGHKTMLLHAASLTEEVLDRLAEEATTTICISALPPFAFVHARDLGHRVRQRLPQNRLLIGLWGTGDDVETLRERFGAVNPEAVVISLAQAAHSISGYACEPALTLANNEKYGEID